MNMQNELRAWRAQLRLMRHHPRGWTSLWVGAAMAALSCLAALAGLAGIPGAGIGAGFLALGALYFCWGAYLCVLVSTTGGAIQHLVPRLDKAQILLTGVLHFAFCMLAVVMTGALFDAKISMWVVVMLGFWSCGTIYVPMSFVTLVIAVSIVPTWKLLPPELRVELLGTPGYAVAVSIALLMSFVVLPALLRHRRVRNGYMVEQAHSNTQLVVHAGAKALPNPVYHCLARSTIRRRDAAGMALLALGPGGHWGNYLLVGLISTVLGIGMTYWSDLGAADQAQVGIDIVVQLACASILLIFAFQVQANLSSMFSRRGEQALVWLAPAAPAFETFNRQLGLALLARVALGWVSMLGLSLLFGVVAGASSEALLRGLGLASISLLLLPTVVRDYARLRDARDFLVGTLLVVALGGVIAIAAFVPYFALVLAPLCLVSTLLLCWLRLDAASTAAPIFPAGGACT